MEKLIYLARKLKAFTYNEIFMLAEMPKEELNQLLEQLITENVIKKDTQGYLFIKDFENFEPPKTTRVKPFIEGSEYDKFKQKQKEKEKKEKSDKPKNYGFFVPHNELSEKFSFYEIINNFLEKYAAKFCTPSTIQTYRSLLKNHILPYFKTKRLEEIDDLVIKDFFRYCEEKGLSPRRFKNTMTLLKQVLNYANNKGFTSNSFSFQVKRLTPRNEFSLNRIVFNQGVC